MAHLISSHRGICLLCRSQLALRLSRLRFNRFRLLLMARPRALELVNLRTQVVELLFTLLYLLQFSAQRCEHLFAAVQLTCALGHSLFQIQAGARAGQRGRLPVGRVPAGVRPTVQRLAQLLYSRTVLIHLQKGIKDHFAFSKAGRNAAVNVP